MSLSETIGWGEKFLLVGVGAYIGTKTLGGPITIALALGAIFLQFWLIKRKFDLWTDLGIPGPKPTFWVGHMGKYTSVGTHACDMEWVPIYGRIYGTYLMQQPELMIADVELLKGILVKDFANFTNRRDFSAVVGKEGNLFHSMLTILKDEHWKNVRNTITPAFTSGKMKHMTPMIEDCTRVLNEILEEKALKGESFMVKDTFGAFATDLIAATAFATRVDSQRDPNNLFVKYAKEVNNIKFFSPKIVFSLAFPFISKQISKWFDVEFMAEEAQEFFTSSLAKIIEDRRKQPQTSRVDFLQLLLNSAAKDVKSDSEGKDVEIDHEVGGKKIALTEMEIMAQSFLFLVAGFDTTATTLSFTCYELAQNPDIQEKLYQEILDVTGESGAVKWDMVQHQMPYLEAVILETLRKYPPAPRFDRHCTADYKLTDEITIPGNTVVGVAAYVIHHSEEYYPDPERFDPERFSPEEKAKRNPLTFLAFGYGPRNCIGMRFAQLEMKFCLVHLLRKFRLVPGDKTEKLPLKLKSPNLLAPVAPIELALEIR